jgi:hypothetical protein
MLAYSIAMRFLNKRGLCDWFSGNLITIGDIGRALFDESIRNTINWIIDQFGIDCGKNLKKLLKQLHLA